MSRATSGSRSGSGSGSASEWIVYEWAALRVVPHVHAEEFLDVGIIAHARQASFLEARLGPSWEARLETFAPALDRDRVRRHLESYVRICEGDEKAGPIALLPPSERFHWLTHPRSGIIQTSATHPGRCRNMKDEIERLLEEQCPSSTPR